ncbi:MAG TPA: hypothetical protein VHT26_01720 [Trebonia sp.]|nr:hypothetical protein [Trebonia sp.]
MNTDVEELLREGMERYTADLRAPAGLTYRVARRRRRRLALRSLTGGAAALAAGAAALAVLVPNINGAGRPAVDAAYVVKNVSNALSAAEPGTIAQMTVTTTGALPYGGTATTTTGEEWSNGQQWRSVTYSSPGHPAYDEGYSTKSGYTLVSYPTRTWARQAGVGQPAVKSFGTPPATRGCGPAFGAFPVLFRLGLPGTSTSASSLPTTVAAALHTAVSCGTLTVAGRQTVDGTEAIELTSRAGSLIAETVWVNPGTYLPVRVVVRSPAGTPGIQQTADFTWLAPTAQNLAKLTVPIPAGFLKVSLFQAVTPNLKLIPGGSVPKPSALAFTRPALLCLAGRLPRLAGGFC